LLSIIDQKDYQNTITPNWKKNRKYNEKSMQGGLTLNKQKTKIMRINAGTEEPVKIEGEV